MSKTGGKGLPLVAFRLDPEKGHHYDEFAVAHHLRERGWVVPAYTMAPHSEKLKLMRVVVREDFSRSRCDTLIKDIKLAVDTLNEMDKKTVDDHVEYVLLISRPEKLDANVFSSSRHIKKNTRHGKKRHQHKHYDNEEHSLQGKSGKVGLILFAFTVSNFCTNRTDLSTEPSYLLKSCAVTIWKSMQRPNDVYHDDQRYENPYTA